jgi:hypothetical protein
LVKPPRKQKQNGTKKKARPKYQKKWEKRKIKKFLKKRKKKENNNNDEKKGRSFCLYSIFLYVYFLSHTSMGQRESVRTYQIVPYMRLLESSKWRHMHQSVHYMRLLIFKMEGTDTNTIFSNSSSDSNLHPPTSKNDDARKPTTEDVRKQ